MGISRNQLYDLEKRYKEDPIMPHKDKPGRPMMKITSPMKCKIVRNIKKEPFKTPVKMTREINMNLPGENQISPPILRRCAQMNGLIA